MAVKNLPSNMLFQDIQREMDKRRRESVRAQAEKLRQKELFNQPIELSPQVIALPPYVTLPGQEVPKRNMKYLLDYELDLIRHQVKTVKQDKNMIHIEQAFILSSGRKPSHTNTNSNTKKILLHRQFPKRKPSKLQKNKLMVAGSCNKEERPYRYCGGAHTLISPEQRVYRLGHFYNQWGPACISVDEVPLLGCDGKIYKGRRMPSILVTSTMVGIQPPSKFVKIK